MKKNPKLMPCRCKHTLSVLATAMVLSACGGGGGGSTPPPDNQLNDPAPAPQPTTFSLSGTLTLPPQTRVDSDTNDPNESYTANDTLASAQVVNDPQALSGFVTAIPTQANGDRFAAGADAHDVYRVSLQAGQRIHLQIGDWLAEDSYANDLDLHVYDPAGNHLASSYGSGPSEAIDIHADGTYYLQVEAFQGTSNYVISLSSVGAASLTTPHTYQWNSTQRFLPGEALVRFRNPAAFQTRARSVGVTIPKPINEQVNRVVFNLAQPVSRMANGDVGHPLLRDFEQRGFHFSSEQAEKLVTIRQIKQLANAHEVQYAEPNLIATALMTPNDAYYSRQWHYPAINLPLAWDQATGMNAIVAVIDTGVYVQHPDLQSNLIAGYDFISQAAMSQDGDGIDNNPDDPGDGDSIVNSTFHGTHVAGTVAAVTNNGVGVAGVAFNARIMPIRVLGKGGGTLYDIIQGMRYAAGLSNDSGTLPRSAADVLNMSLGGYGYSQAYQDTVTQVRQQGVIIVAAAGNENTSEPSMPAALEGVVSVSAIGQDGGRAAYSNFGSSIDVAAPGGDQSRDEGVLSLAAQDNGAGMRAPSLMFSQGTSMATPHMAGVAALMKSVAPEMTPQQFDDLLRSGRMTNDLGPVGRDDVYGHGVIDALKAVQAASELVGGSIPDSVTVSPSAVDVGVGAQVAVTVAGTGAGLRVTGVTVDEPWLQVVATNVNALGLGSYRVQVERNGLKPARYSAQVTFTLSSGNPLILPVFMTVANPGGTAGDTTGTAYVVLVDAATESAVDTVMVIPQSGRYEFTFDHVPTGNYVLAAGTDHDNDGVICDGGEACGLYPLLGAPQPVVVSGDMRGRDFMLVPDATLVTPTLAGAGRQAGVMFRRQR